MRDCEAAVQYAPSWRGRHLHARRASGWLFIEGSIGAGLIPRRSSATEHASWYVRTRPQLRIQQFQSPVD